MLGTEALWHDCISDTNFPVKLQICFKVIISETFAREIMYQWFASIKT